MSYVSHCQDLAKIYSNAYHKGISIYKINLLSTINLIHRYLTDIVESFYIILKTQLKHCKDSLNNNKYEKKVSK